MEKELLQITKEARDRLITDGIDADAIDAYIELETGDDDLSDFEEAYAGKFSGDEEFAQDMAENIGATPSLMGDTTWPLYCIDWERAARELMMDYSEQNGYYFRSL